ncbi:MAG TPA: chromate resistance protein ChrB domain-containing protein [Ramlibacter sp.]|nr:chromate resistance protein ChrB domain-containing protein [Ramlibacter sp.]
MDTASHSISPEQFAAHLGRPDAPLVLDVRREERFAESERMLPAARRCAPEQVARFAASGSPAQVVVYCVHGLEIGQQAAAELRAAGWDARYLQGGIEGWIERGLPTLRKRPDLGVTGERPSRWITRERPKIDRVACPWLVRQFIDPAAQFLYVPAGLVLEEARRLSAVAYDIAGAPITHDGELCSFDALLRAFDLREPSLLALARVVRGADTGRLDLAPQSAGLLAFSLGLARLHSDDQSMLRAALPVYDALYAWCRAAQDAQTDQAQGLAP